MSAGHGRSGRRGVTLIEVLFTTLLLALPLVVAMTLMGSNTRATAHNRERVMAQMLVANLVARYGWLPLDRLDGMFGDGTGGREHIDRDVVMESCLPWTTRQLDAWGVRRECFLHKLSGETFAGVLYCCVSYRDVFGRLQRVQARSLIDPSMPSAEQARLLAGGASAPPPGAEGTPSAKGGGSSAPSPEAHGSDGGGLRGWSFSDDASTRTRGATSPALAAEARAMERLATLLAAVDARDGRLDYAWAALRAPDEEAGALARVTELLQRRPAPDGDYRVTWEPVDYRLVDPGFGLARETVDLTLFTLTAPGTGASYLMLLERHGRQGRPEPTCELLDGALLRTEGLHALRWPGGPSSRCAAAVTPERFFLVRQARDPEGRPHDVARELSIRTFEEPWVYESVEEEEDADGEARDPLGEQLTALYAGLGVEPAELAPEAGAGPHPLGL